MIKTVPDPNSSLDFAGSKSSSIAKKRKLLSLILDFLYFIDYINGVTSELFAN